MKIKKLTPLENLRSLEKKINETERMQGTIRLSNEYLDRQMSVLMKRI